MAVNWMRRTLLATACVSMALLTACGSSTVESAITPDRFIAFGDGFSDVGQNGSLYTVNDGSVNNWSLQLVSRYSKSLTAVSAGGTSYAVGNARVTAKPDAAGNASTLTVTEQVSKFLASGKFNANDIALINGGPSDIIAGYAAVSAGTQTAAEFSANSRQAGLELAAQVRRLVDAGAKHVVVTGTYDLGKTLWAKSIAKESVLTDASTKFNEGLLLGITDLGATVLYVDTAYYFNLFEASPSSYGFSNATAPICNSVDANNGIGIGTGQVNSSLCNASTLVEAGKQDNFLFADQVYLTPNAHRQLGNYFYDRLHARW